MIPITVVDVTDAEPFVLEVLRSGAIAQGPMVRRFEEAFAQEVGVAHAVAVNSGTTALVAALQALEVVPGDEVVTSPFTAQLDLVDGRADADHERKSIMPAHRAVARVLNGSAHWVGAL